MPVFNSSSGVVGIEHLKSLKLWMSKRAERRPISLAAQEVPPTSIRLLDGSQAMPLRTRALLDTTMEFLKDLGVNNCNNSP